MSNSSQSTDLPSRIQQLLNEREQHKEAIEKIDRKLAGISSVLGGAGNGASAVRPAPRPVPVAAPVRAMLPAPTPAPKPAAVPGRPARHATSAVDSVMGFVRQHRNPTTQQIKAHWEREGRGWKVDVLLSKLVKEGKLTRTPLGEGLRGSRFTLG